jgi:hypothetical protein
MHDLYRQPNAALTRMAKLINWRENEKVAERETV